MYFKIKVHSIVTQKEKKEKKENSKSMCASFRLYFHSFASPTLEIFLNNKKCMQRIKKPIKLFYTF